MIVRIGSWITAVCSYECACVYSDVDVSVDYDLNDLDDLTNVIVDIDYTETWNIATGKLPYHMTQLVISAI